MQKVVIVFGSPRKNSNTHILVQEAQKGLTDSGVASEIFFLNRMKIKGCQACYHCKKNDSTICIINDDMSKIHQAMETGDGLIVATPIYFAGVTAQTKTWLDRMFPYIDINLGAKLPKGKKVAFIFTQNQPNATLFSAAIKTFQAVMNILGYETKGSLLACNLNKGYKPMVTEDKNLMQKAYDLGKYLLDESYQSPS
jgi:multimeric flavodoxin WrbA